MRFLAHGPSSGIRAGLLLLSNSMHYFYEAGHTLYCSCPETDIMCTTSTVLKRQVRGLLLLLFRSRCNLALVA